MKISSTLRFLRVYRAIIAKGAATIAKVIAATTRVAVFKGSNLVIVN